LAPILASLPITIPGLQAIQGCDTSDGRLLLFHTMLRASNAATGLVTSLHGGQFQGVSPLHQFSGAALKWSCRLQFLVWGCGPNGLPSLLVVRSLLTDEVLQLGLQPLKALMGFPISDLWSNGAEFLVPRFLKMPMATQ
jgi:hypothetical protein